MHRTIRGLMMAGIINHLPEVPSDGRQWWTTDHRQSCTVWSWHACTRPVVSPVMNVNPCVSVSPPFSHRGPDGRLGEGAPQLMLRASSVLPETEGGQAISGY